jgi:hypothetical protein
MPLTPEEHEKLESGHNRGRGKGLPGWQARDGSDADVLWPRDKASLAGDTGP